MEEKFQKARILENIERYLKFEGVAFNDELMVVIHTMLVEAKKELEPKRNESALHLMMDLLRRKIDFTSDNTTMKQNAYDFFMKEAERLAENETNVEKKSVLNSISKKFKSGEYTEFFDKFIKGEHPNLWAVFSENDLPKEDKEYLQFEKNIQCTHLRVII